MDLNFRTLTPDEIDVRVDQVINTPRFLGCRVLLYKDARVDMNLLDEVVGCMNWKREHRRENANCVISIWDSDKKEWISKEDTGSESNQDAAKGLASDSFKRAAVNWGIGRELYSAPKAMLVQLTQDDFTEKDGKRFLNKNIKFLVKEIGYDEKRNINKLVITNQDGNVVYEFPTKKKASPKPAPQPKQEKQVEKQAAPQQPAQKPAPAPEKLELTSEQEDLYTQLCADLDSAANVASVLATEIFAEKQPFELAIRKKAAKRGIDLATTKAEVNQSYALIKDREGWEEMKKYALKIVEEKNLQ